MSTLPQLPGLSPLGNAIANAEGFNVPGSIPNTLNNPGDIQDSNGNFLNFNTLTDGASYLQNMINGWFSGSSSLYNPSMTLQQTANTYVNGNSNTQTQGSTNWANNVAQALGLTPNSTLGQAQNANASTTANAAANPYSTTTNNPIDNAIMWVLNLLSGNTQRQAQSTQQAEQITTSALSRVMLGIIGLLLIAAGLFAFRPTQSVIQSGGNLVSSMVSTNRKKRTDYQKAKSEYEENKQKEAHKTAKETLKTQAKKAIKNKVVSIKGEAEETGEITAA
jgi:hypothetical protein